MLELLQRFSAWCLPRLCVCCGFASNNWYLDLCRACKSNLPWLHDVCYQCGAPLTPGKEAVVCIRCLENPPPYNRLCALFNYDLPVSGLINQLKFGQKLFPGALFGQLLAEAIIQRWYTDISLPQLIIPVPLHTNRQRKRGYNQALEISTPISKILRIPIDLNVCTRIKHTQPQTKLNKEQRQQNLIAAFAVKPLKYKHVAVVDDVVTSGSTVRNISLALYAAGAETIDVWAVCRA